MGDIIDQTLTKIDIPLKKECVVVGGKNLFCTQEIWVWSNLRGDITCSLTEQMTQLILSISLLIYKVGLIIISSNSHTELSQSQPIRWVKVVCKF